MTSLNEVYDVELSDGDESYYVIDETFEELEQSLICLLSETEEQEFEKHEVEYSFLNGGTSSTEFGSISSIETEPSIIGTSSVLASQKRGSEHYELPKPKKTCLKGSDGDFSDAADDIYKSFDEVSGDNSKILGDKTVLGQTSKLPGISGVTSTVCFDLFTELMEPEKPSPNIPQNLTSPDIYPSHQFCANKNKATIESNATINTLKPIASNDGSKASFSYNDSPYSKRHSLKLMVLTGKNPKILIKDEKGNQFIGSITLESIELMTRLLKLSNSWNGIHLHHSEKEFYFVLPNHNSLFIRKAINNKELSVEKKVKNMLPILDFDNHISQYFLKEASSQKNISLCSTMQNIMEVGFDKLNNFHSVIDLMFGKQSTGYNIRNLSYSFYFESNLILDFSLRNEKHLKYLNVFKTNTDTSFEPVISLIELDIPAPNDIQSTQLNSIDRGSSIEVIVLGDSLDDNIKAKEEQTSRENNPILPNSNAKKEQIPITFPEEEKDILHPEWDVIKKLETDEQRYKQVRSRWRSSKIPDPNKDLTFHSFRRKRVLCSKPSCGLPQVLKRAAAPLNSPLKPSKIRRTNSVPCTYIIDSKIDDVRKQFDESHNIASYAYENNIQHLSENQASFRYGYGMTPYSFAFTDPLVNAVSDATFEIMSLQYDAERERIEGEYMSTMTEAKRERDSKLEILIEAKNEVAKFCKFYKGLDYKESDPTVLTERQIRELTEIENVYNCFPMYYDNPNG